MIFPPSALLPSIPPTQQDLVMLTRACFSPPPQERHSRRAMPKREFYQHCIFEGQVEGKRKEKKAEATVCWKH